MSIAIDSMKCRACGKCLDVCPGSLIVQRRRQKAVIRYPKDCWGCASCIKECPFEAISYYLGADIGGMGSQMTVIRKEICYTGELKNRWYNRNNCCELKRIRINIKEEDHESIISS